MTIVPAQRALTGRIRAVPADPAGGPGVRPAVPPPGSPGRDYRFPMTPHETDSARHLGRRGFWTAGALLLGVLATSGGVATAAFAVSDDVPVPPPCCKSTVTPTTGAGSTPPVVITATATGPVSGPTNTITLTPPGPGPWPTGVITITPPATVPVPGPVTTITLPPPGH